jgi:hypothetical protein
MDDSPLPSYSMKFIIQKVTHDNRGVTSIELEADKFEYLFMGLHALQEKHKQFAEEDKDKTISRNDIIEGVGGVREDPITNPQPEPVNMSDLWSAQYVDVKELLSRLVSFVGYDMAEEG